MELIFADYAQAISHCRAVFGQRFFEFYFTYTPMQDRFREIDRYLWESKHACTRFANRYDGPVVIDLSDWSSAAPNDYFDAFLYFLKDQIDEDRCILISDKQCETAILKRLEKLFRLERTDRLEPSAETRVRKIGFCAQEEEAEHV